MPEHSDTVVCIYSGTHRYDSQRNWLADKLWIMSGACTPTSETIRTGSILRQARERAGLTQRELADRLGCSPPAISQAEAGGASPSIATLQRFADALGCYLPVDIRPRGTVLHESVPRRLPT